MEQNTIIDISMYCWLCWINNYRPKQTTIGFSFAELMGMIPVGSGIFSKETIGKGLIGLDGVLCNAGHSILRVGYIDTMPVNGNAKRKVIDHMYNHQISLLNSQGWSGSNPVKCPGRNADAC